MSAQDNLSPKQFYHGTRSHLEEGDLIEPGRALAQPSSQPTGHVFATTDMHDAAFFAASAQSKQHPHVYRVEPTGDVEPDPEDERGLSIRTKSPLRVQGLAAMEYYGSIPFKGPGSD